MIKTTYVLVKQAAEMLSTDEDTLLIAAIEGRIKLFGFLGEELEAWLMTPDKNRNLLIGEDILNEPVVEGLYFSSVDDIRWFDFVPLDHRDAACIFKEGFCSITEVLSEPDTNGSFWSIDDSEFESLAIENYPKVLRKNVFLKHSDVEAIKTKAQLPEPHTVPKPPISKSADTRRNNTLLIIIAALAKQANIDLTKPDTVSRMERFTELYGHKVTDDTIRKIIRQIVELG